MNVKCPKCGEEVEVSQAIQHEIQEEVLNSIKEQHKKELETVRAETDKTVMEEMKLMKEELDLKDEKLDEARKIELDMRKQKNALEEEKKNFELEKQRQLDEERKKIAEKVGQDLAEQHRMKDKEKDKMIDDLKSSLEDAQRKAAQSSQQLQGEVQELDLEELLRSAFVGDSIEAVGKGVLGADVRQIVRSPKGMDCGKILWESKRTKAWSDGWIDKLKEDTRNDKSNIAVIVSETLPDEFKNGVGQKDGVWVISPAPGLILPIAQLLRKALLDAARQRVVAENKQSRAESVYSYVTSHEFAQQVEGMVEVYMNMKNQITKERVAFEKSWKEREMQVDRVLSGFSGIYGSIQGIAGPAMPQIKSLQLESGEDVNS